MSTADSPLPQDALYSEVRREAQATGSAFVLTLVVLLLNAGLNSVMFSLSGAGLACALLLWRHDRARSRGWHAMRVSVVLMGLGALAVAFLVLDGEEAIIAIARLSCGISWILWLGTRADWRAFRTLIRTVGIPPGVVATLDLSLLHGSVTATEWSRRRDAARLRAGTAALPPHVWANLLAAGAVATFERLDRVGRHAQVRAAACLADDTDVEAACELRNVSLTLAGKPILRECSFRLDRGQWVALCGPSGAGKSCLLNIIVGLLAPTEGDLHRLGVHITPPSRLRARLDGRVGMLCQNPEHQMIASTVAADIAWGLEQREIPATAVSTRVGAIAQELGIAHLLTRPCHQLSYGEQRRVSLAGILVLEPDLLLLDEPTAGLDPVAAWELVKSVRAIVARRRVACVWVTHDLPALPADIERVILLRGGVPIFDGPASAGLSPVWLARAALLPQHQQS